MVWDLVGKTVVDEAHAAGHVPRYDHVVLPTDSGQREHLDCLICDCLVTP